MTLNTYEIIDLTDQIGYKGISKFKRHKIEAITPMQAVRTLFPNFTPKLDRQGMGNIVVVGKHRLKNGIFDTHYTFNLFPIEGVAV